jgi:predicted small lipoprotein YifL
LHGLSQSKFSRLALIGVLAAAFALAACGRKGPLDPPPGASLEGVAQPGASRLISNAGASRSSIGSGSGDYSGVGPDGQVQAPPGPKKRIPLDNLLN